MEKVPARSPYKPRFCHQPDPLPGSRELGTYLGERLAEHNLVALRNEVSNSKCVSFDITRGETLVCLLSVSYLMIRRGLTISNKARCFLDLINSDNSFHCS
jgi:hypothetical protein